MQLEPKPMVVDNFTHQCCKGIGTMHSAIITGCNSVKLKHVLIRRKKIWELEHNYHCAVIGTCLSMKEVRNLLRQFQVKVDNYCDYDMHTIAVTMLEEKDHRTKKVNNYLDRKFKTSIQAIKKMGYSALKKYWHESLKTGEIIGAFWAILSHPLSDSQMQRDVYGDIHMLSHLSGASNRADLKQLQELRDERSNLHKEINIWKSKSLNKLSDVDKLNNEIKNHINNIAGLEQKIKSLEKYNDKLLRQASGQQYQKLQQKIQNYQQKNFKQEGKISLLAKKIEFLNEQILLLNNAQQKDNLSISHYQLKTQRLESKLIELKTSDQSDCEQCELKDESLCGRCILYVGGQTGMTPHYKDIVESKSAVFMHHDGGIEKNTHELTNMLNRADIVICPTSFISHTAYWQIKKSCKKQNKPCMFIKSSGVSSLTKTLKNISEAEL